MKQWPTVAALLGSVAVAAVVGCSAPTTTLPVSQTSSPTSIKPPVENVPDANELNNNTNAIPSGPDTSATPSAFVLTFHGNKSTDISTANLPFAFNPFCPVSYTSGCNPVVNFDPSTNSTGSTLTGFPFDPNTPESDQEFHVGAIFRGGRDYAVSADLKYGPYGTAPVPFISVNPAKLVKKSPSWAYAEVYVAASLKSGGKPVLNSWTEIGYVPNGSAQPKFTFENHGKQTLYVESSGIILDQPIPTDPACRKLNPLCPDDYKILASLNFIGSPPPGYSGSQFIPMQYPPPKVLKPKGI